MLHLKTESYPLNDDVYDKFVTLPTKPQSKVAKLGGDYKEF